MAKNLNMCCHSIVNNNVDHTTGHSWGEPERAPHLMMSTAVCMSFVRRTYGKHLPEDELMGTSGSKCTLITAQH